MDWFRMYGDMPNDPKIGTLTDAQFRTWVELLCSACKAEKSGGTGLTMETVNWALRRNVTETLQKLIETNLLFIDEGGELVVTAWEKRQYARDSSTGRVKKFREKQKNQALENRNADETLQKRFCNGLEQNRTDTEQSNNPIGLFAASDADDLLGRTPSADFATCPHQKIIDLYHEVLPMCPRVRDWTPARATQLRARWNEDKKRQSLDWWRGFFEYIEGSDFLTGRSVKPGKDPFFADLEWITKSANFVKIREGKYENRDKK